MKTVLTAGLLSLGLLVGFGATTAHATAGAGASTTVKLTTYNDGAKAHKTVKSYKYFTVTNLYLPEKPTKAQKTADAKRSKMVTNVLKGDVQSRFAYDVRSFDNRDKNQRRPLLDYTRKVTQKLIKNSKTSMTVRTYFYESVSDRHNWIAPTKPYKYVYQDTTFNKKTGKVTKGTQFKTVYYK